MVQTKVEFVEKTFEVEENNSRSRSSDLYFPTPNSVPILITIIPYKHDIQKAMPRAFHSMHFRIECIRSHEC